MPSPDELQFERALVAGEHKRILELIADQQLDVALQQVLALEKQYPGDAEVVNLKGSVYLALGDIARARASFEQAATLKPDSIAPALNLAQLDLRDNKPGAARQRFSAILDRDPSNAAAMIGVAAVEAAQGHDAEYLSWVNKAAESAPTMVGPRILLARYYVDKSETQKALAIARDLVDAHPTDIRALRTLSEVQAAAGQSAEATATLSRMTTLFPNDAQVHYKLAERLIAANAAGAARTELGKALALRPGYVDASVLLATLELSLGNNEAALRVARQLAEKHPGVPAGVVLEGDVLLANKDIPGAQKAYRRAWEMHRSSGTAMKLHTALTRAGKPREAEEIMLEWLKQQPTDVTARLYLGDAYVGSSQYDKAIAQYQLALQSDKDNVRALNNLAWCYQQKRDPRALATAERAYQLAPASPDIADTLAMIVLDKGDTKRALELLDRAASTPSASGSVRFHYASALLKSGDNARARRQLERLLESKQPFPQRAEAEALLKQTR